MGRNTSSQPWSCHGSKAPPQIQDKDYKFPKGYPFVTDGSPTGGMRPSVRSPWYDKQCREIGDSRAVARDLDINPSGSVSQFFDALVINDLVRLVSRPPVWEGELDDFGLGLVRKAGGRIKMWVQPDTNGLPPLGRYGAGADVSFGTGASPRASRSATPIPAKRCWSSSIPTSLPMSLPNSAVGF
jgi:hypothetical protein